MKVKRLPTGPKQTVQQKSYYRKMRSGGRTDNILVRARAGCGKTTTLLTGTEYAPENSIVVCAFNRRIAQELNNRVPRGGVVKAKTLHAIGFGIMRKFWPYSKVNDDQPHIRERSLTEAVLKEIGDLQRCPFPIKRLIGKLHTAGREIVPHAVKPGDLAEIAEDLELIPDPQFEAQGYDLSFVEDRALRAMVLAENETPDIDYADMIYLPCRMHWHNPTVGLVKVDEAQDMTPSQLEIAMGICAGRMAIIGDDRQAIYAFRGAGVGTLDKLKAELKAEEFGLTQTFRCGLAIVELAQRLVPDFEAGPNNPDGEVLDMMAQQLVGAAAYGDFILSRTNAPIAEICMQLLRAGKRCRIAGRDIGGGLIALIQKLVGADEDVSRLLKAIAEWRLVEVQRLIDADKEHRIGPVNDKAEVLNALCMDAATVSEIRTRIVNLFTDEGLGDAGIITLSSVHRAKGLEANRVFVLWDTIRGDSIEEQNIEYVAITRAKQTLVRVHGIGGRPKFKK